MIASLRGTILRRATDRLVVEIGGVGLEVQVPARVAQAASPGQEITVHTTLVVREDSLTLFGFGDEAERDLFGTLQTVSGVGPRLALTVLSTLTVPQFAAAVSSDDLATLTSVPGIGRKSAQRLVVELRDKVAATGGPVAAGPASGARWPPQVRAALVGLGWTAAEAESAVSALAAEQPDLSVSEALRLALRSLDRADRSGP